MESSPTKLIDFFSFDCEKMAEGDIVKFESNVNLSDLKDLLSEKMDRKKWPVALKELLKKAEGFLQDDFADIMTSAWEKYQSISEHLENSKNTPDETFLLPLAEHEIHSVQNPFVEILINENSVGRVTFNIDISILLKGIILKIINGEIREIETGSCEAQGTFSCEDIQLLEKKLEPVKLPGTIILKHPDLPTHTELQQ